MSMSGLPLYILKNEEKVGVRKTHSTSLQTFFHSSPTSTLVGCACVCVLPCVRKVPASPSAQAQFCLLTAYSRARN